MSLLWGGIMKITDSKKLISTSEEFSKPSPSDKFFIDSKDRQSVINNKYTKLLLKFNEELRKYC